MGYFHLAWIVAVAAVQCVCLLLSMYGRRKCVNNLYCCKWPRPSLCICLLSLLHHHSFTYSFNKCLGFVIAVFSTALCLMQSEQFLLSRRFDVRIKKINKARKIRRVRINIILWLFSVLLADEFEVGSAVSRHSFRIGEETKRNLCEAIMIDENISNTRKLSQRKSQSDSRHVNNHKRQTWEISRHLLEHIKEMKRDRICRSVFKAPVCMQSDFRVVCHL